MSDSSQKYTKILQKEGGVARWLFIVLLHFTDLQDSEKVPSVMCKLDLVALLVADHPRCNSTTDADIYHMSDRGDALSTSSFWL